MTSQSSIAIVAWKKLSRRSELFAEALNARLWFFKDNIPYARAFTKTLLMCVHEKPRVLLVQLPQGPLLLVALLLRKLIGCRVVADLHTGFVLSTDWKGRLLNEPFVKLLPKADMALVHNETQFELIPKKTRNKTIVVYDPWIFIEKAASLTQTTHETYLVFPASFAPDEPLQEVIAAMEHVNTNAKMYITGNWKRTPEMKRYESEQIRFTGFLPNEKYGSLLANATAIVSGTKREYTSLMSGWEAVANDKPLALNETRALKDLYGGYAVFYDYKNSQSITEAINEILTLKPRDAARERLAQKTANSIELFKQRLKRLS